MAIVIEGECMKRVLMGLLVLLGFVIAGCENEEAREHHRDGYYGTAYPRDGYYGQSYPREGYPRDERRREYRLSDETIQNGGTGQTNAETRE